jgi:hypothetical protein
MGRDRHSKVTTRLGEDELQRLASGPSAQRANATVRNPLGVREIRPTSKIHKDELVELVAAAKAAERPTDPSDLEVELQVFDPDQVKKVRSTQRSRATLYQLIVRAKADGVPVTFEELEQLTDEQAEALVAARRAQVKPIAAGSSVIPMPTARGSLSPEAALDLLEQGITDEPPELEQSGRPFAHSIALEPELALEAARRREPSQTAPLSVAQVDAVTAVARKIATGEIVPLPRNDLDERRYAPSVSRDLWLLVAIATSIVAFTTMFALIAVR